MCDVVLLLCFLSFSDTSVSYFIHFFCFCVFSNFYYLLSSSCAYWLVRVIMKKPDHLRDLTAEAEQHRKAVIRRQKIAAGEDVDDEDD